MVRRIAHSLPGGWNQPALAVAWPQGSGPAVRRLARYAGHVLLAALLLASLASCGTAGQTHAFVLLPDASATAVALPEELRLQAGDSLQITNNDAVPRQVGALLLAPGETLTQRFPGPGRFEYSCSVHEGGRLVVIVER